MTEPNGNRSSLNEFDRPLDARLMARWLEKMNIWSRNHRSEVEAIIGVPPESEFRATPKPIPSGFELFPIQGSAWVANLLVVFMATSSIFHWQRTSGGLSPFVASRVSVFTEGQYWRLLTALGGHGDLMHILHNAPIFWFFAWILNGYFGWVVALFGSLSIGVISNALTVWTYEDRVQLLGASGMVYGMVAMWLTLYIRFDRNGLWAKRVLRSLGFALLVLFPQTFEPNVSYLAHASGFAVGILVGLLSIPFVKTRAPVFVDQYYGKSLVDRN